MAPSSLSGLEPSLRPRDYVDPDVFARERDVLLPSSWLPLCRVDQVAAPGDRLAVTLLGRPLIVTRDADGALHVLGNVCPHRGSLIVEEGRGREGTLVCPYHRWAFRLDGSFVGAPLAQGASLDDVCLPTVRHVEWQGFVLADLSGDAPDPTEPLAGLAAELATWRWDELVTVGTRTYESRWNWKVMVENWIECYHHLGTHRSTLEPVQPARTTRMVEAHGAPWCAMTVESVEGLEGDPATWIPGLPAERSRDLSVWAAFPLLLGGSVARYAFWLRLEPLDVDRHLVTWHLLAHPDQLGQVTEESVVDDLAVIDVIHGEDMAACARVHAGLASGLLDSFRLVPLEAPVADFQRWVASRLGASRGRTE